MTDKKYTLGIDIGSTTVKIAILDEENQLLFADYERHFANIQETLAHLLGEAHEKLGELTLQPVITGSGGLALANHLGIPFTQEVIAVSTSLKALAPQTDVAIELGGEDAKIIYFEGGNVEQRFFHRPDGFSSADRCNRTQRIREALPGDLSDRSTLRCIRKNRYPAAHQRRCNKRGSFRFHFPGSCQPDHFWSCLR